MIKRAAVRSHIQSNVFLSCCENSYANVWFGVNLEYGVPLNQDALLHIQSNEGAFIFLWSDAPRWKWHHSPWPGARCPLGPPAPDGSPSQPLVWPPDWPGTPPARPSSGCPSALGSFPFSDPPGAPSELPFQTYQCAEEKKECQGMVKQMDGLRLKKENKKRMCVLMCVFELIRPAVWSNDDKW